MKSSLVRRLCGVGFAGWLALSGAASAQTEAYTNAPANLRAGPASEYPLVARIPPGAFVSVIGCLSDYTWCDVAVPNLRGWIYAARLSYPYEGTEVPLMEYGATLGFPVVGFYLDSYWDRYYGREPWFHDRDRWRHTEPRFGPDGRPPGRGPEIDRRPGGAFGGPPPAEHEHGIRRQMPPRGPGDEGRGPQHPGAGIIQAPGPQGGGGRMPDARGGGPVHAPSMGGAPNPPPARQDGGGERGFGHDANRGGDSGHNGGGNRGSEFDQRRN